MMMHTPQYRQKTINPMRADIPGVSPKAAETRVPTIPRQMEMNRCQPT